MWQQLWDQQGENTLWRKCWEIWVTQAQTWEGWMLRFLSGGFKVLVQSVSFLSCFAMKESSSVQVDVLLWNSYSPDHLCRGLHLLHLWASLQHNLVFEPTSPCTIPAFLFLFSSLFFQTVLGGFRLGAPYLPESCIADFLFFPLLQIIFYTFLSSIAAICWV